MPAVKPDRDAAPAKHRAIVVFIHIPKTAGTSLTRVLRLSEPRGHLRVGNVFKGSGGVDTGPYEVVAERLKEERDAVFLAGHLPFGVADYLPRDQYWDFRFITFLRNPVDRALSHYYFHLQRMKPGYRGPKLLVGPEQAADKDPENSPPLTDDVPLETAFASMHYVPDNLQTRMLSGLAEPFGEVNEEMLEAAKANLNKFALVGLAERYDESLVLLKQRFGYSAILAEDARVNQQRPRQQEVPKKVAAAAEKANRFDIELYKHAEELFSRAPELDDLGFAAELAALGHARSSRSGELPSPPASYPSDAGAWRTLIDTRAELLQRERAIGILRLAIADAIAQARVRLTRFETIVDRFGTGEGKLEEARAGKLELAREELEATRKHYEDLRLSSERVDRRVALGYNLAPPPRRMQQAPTAWRTQSASQDVDRRLRKIERTANTVAAQRDALQARIAELEAGLGNGDGTEPPAELDQLRRRADRAHQRLQRLKQQRDKIRRNPAAGKPKKS